MARITTPAVYRGNETIGLVGSRKIVNDLRRMQEVMLAPEVVLEAEFDVLEQVESDVYAGLNNPSYRQTDATMESLTQREASGAIRRIIAGGVAGGNSTKPGIEFGTSIWYAKFQRKIGPPSGKPRGRTRVGPSKILRITAQARAAAAEMVMARIMGRS